MHDMQSQHQTKILREVYKNSAITKAQTHETSHSQPPHIKMWQNQSANVVYFWKALDLLDAVSAGIPKMQ